MIEAPAAEHPWERHFERNNYKINSVFRKQPQLSMKLSNTLFIPIYITYSFITNVLQVFKTCNLFILGNQIRSFFSLPSANGIKSEVLVFDYFVADQND